jgi:hypothetical protein
MTALATGGIRTMRKILTSRRLVLGNSSPDG